MEVENDMVLVSGRNELDFCRRYRNLLRFSVTIDIDFFLIVGMEIDWFLCSGRK